MSMPAKSWARQQMEAAKKTPRKSPEHDIQVEVFRTLAYNEAEHPELKLIHAIPNGGHRNKATAGKLKAEGVRSGVSDVFVPIPSPVTGHTGLYLELKVPGGKPTEAQLEFQQRVREQGFAATVTRSVDETLERLELHLGYKLRRLRRTA